jgi:disulfide bond formation protein DsbB
MDFSELFQHLRKSKNTINNFCKVKIKWTLLEIILCLIGVAGSFWVEFVQGEMPCRLCLIIRYSLASAGTIFIIGLSYEKIKMLSIFPLIPSIMADIVLIINEMKIGKQGICEGNICQTPEFLGVRTSIWALAIILPLIFLSLYEIKKGFAKIKIKEKPQK